MKVSDIMTTKVTTLDRNEKVDAALEIMEDKNIRHLIVTHEGSPISIVSDRDLLVLLSVTAMDNERENPIKIGQVSSKRPITVKPDTSVVEVVQIILEKKISAMPVLDNGKLVGIITTHDLNRLLLKFLSEKA